MHIVIYAKYIPKVGGIETMIFNLAYALSYSNANITLVYDSVESPFSLLRVGKYVNVKRLSEQKIECDICLLSSNHDIPKQIRAKRYIQWIHSDYKKYNIELKNRNVVDKYVAVSEHCKQVACELYPEIADRIATIYNFAFIEFPLKPLKLVTVSRLSPEKGLYRMLDLAHKLKEYNIPFLWTVCGDNSHNTATDTKWRSSFADIEEVSFVGFKKNPAPYIDDADYSVLLSDFEGCPVSLLESLDLYTPVITTNWGGSDEIIHDGINGYIVPMDINQLTKDDIMKMCTHIPQIENDSSDFRDEQVQKWTKLLDTV